MRASLDNGARAQYIYKRERERERVSILKVRSMMVRSKGKTKSIWFLFQSVFFVGPIIASFHKTKK